MKLIIFISLFCLIIAYVYAAPSIEPERPVEKQKDIPTLLANTGEQSQEQDASSAAIRIPVDNANKLLYDLDAQVRQLFDESSILPVKEEKSEDGDVEDAHSYSAANRELDIYPRQTETNTQQASLTTQLENLEKRLLNTINELQTRRRYFSSTMLRQMYNSVHRIRINISRIQNQFSSAQSVPANSSVQRPGQSGMMQSLQQRVTDLQKAVNDIINRVTSTFQGPNAQKPSNPTLQVVNF